MVELTIPCRKCGEVFIVKVTQQELNDFNIGEKTIQRCFPNLSADERELIKTRTCGSCWDKIFGEIDEE